MMQPWIKQQENTGKSVFIWRQEMWASCVFVLGESDSSSWLCRELGLAATLLRASHTLGHAAASAARASRRCEASRGGLVLPIYMFMFTCGVFAATISIQLCQFVTPYLHLAELYDQFKDLHYGAKMPSVSASCSSSHFICIRARRPHNGSPDQHMGNCSSL